MKRVVFAPNVASVQDATATYAAALPDGDIVVLEGTAAVMWELLRDDPETSTLPQRVALRLIDTPSDLAQVVQAFIESLRDQDLLRLDDK